MTTHSQPKKPNQPATNRSVPVALTVFMALWMAITGCTKERPYDDLDQDTTKLIKPEPITLFPENVHYLYVTSDINSTRSSDATFPMYMGDAKIVTLKHEEEMIQVSEVEIDDRFSGNPVNSKPVLSIPIERVDYRCAPDADGKCSNKEEEDLGKPWVQRRYLKIRPNDFAVQEIAAKPIEITNLFEGDCYQELGHKFSDLKVEAEAINISVERTYKSTGACIGNIRSLSDVIFRVVNHYSLVRLDSLTTPGYKPIVYPRDEENTFGYFTTNTLKLDRDNNPVADKDINFVKRWAPNRTVIYHMTENFNKPEYTKIKAATIKAFDNINDTLKLAGADLRVELRDALPNMNPGDLRVNTIAMVEDPVNYGILGYGPSAENPLTGEIVHARAAMYLGVIKTGIKRAYEEVVAEKLSKAAKAKAETKTKPDDDGQLQIFGPTKGDTSLGAELARHDHRHIKLNVDAYAKVKSGQAVGASMLAQLTANARTPMGEPGQSFSRASLPIRTPVNVARLREGVKHLESRRLTLQDAMILKDDPTIREQVLTTHCYYDVEHFNIAGTLEREIDKLVKDLGTKPWIALTDAQKDRVIDTLLPFVWVPTLIHEVGHTLGLRHNFAGSEDKENFYTRAELDKMGIEREFSYSSVMDYGYRATNELQVMGKYDIAALRYGYAEKVELTDGKLISIDEYRAAKPELKQYQYCTDDHVAVNPGCKRFDEGTSLTEIATHWVNMYEENYQRRNFRHGAQNFSLYDDASHMRRLDLVMSSLRTMFERYEDIKTNYRIPDNHAAWNEIDFLKDLKTATMIAAQFYLRVLETPDTICALAPAATPNRIVMVAPIRMLDKDAINCFDPKVLSTAKDEGLAVAGEAGKSFQSRKDPRSTNFYADQIDVRGIWLDKLMAARALTTRLTGIENFDKNTGNFLDIEDMREPIQAALTNILNNEIVTPVPIVTISGQVLVAQLGVSLYDAEPAANSHKIFKPLHPGVKAYFGIPSDGVDFQVQLVDVLKKRLPSDAHKADATSLLNAIKASVRIENGQKEDDYIDTKIGLTTIFVDKESEVATGHLISREVVSTLSTLSEAKIDEILAAIAEGKAPAADASDAEKLAYALGAEVVGKFKEGGFQHRSFYEKMLQAMVL